MKFYSTRNSNNRVSFREAVFQGLAPDGGLYNPAEYPDLSDLFKSMDSKTSFIESSSALSSVILKDDLTPERAQSVCRRAFPSNRN
mgnify:CR=1 FL=1